MTKTKFLEDAFLSNPERDKDRDRSSIFYGWLDTDELHEKLKEVIDYPWEESDWQERETAIKKIMNRNDFSIKVSADLLINDPYNAIRMLVADRKDLDYKHYVHLSQDNDPSVRLAIANNKHVPREILIDLYNDPSSWVRDGVMRRLTPVDVLLAIYKEIKK